MEDGIEIDGSQGPNSGGTVATKILACDFLATTNGINMTASSGATDGEITGCRVIIYSGQAIAGLRGGWQITQCHFSNGTGASGSTLTASSAPVLIANNYFDTNGSNANITVSTGKVSIVGNHFKAASTQPYSIVMSGNGSRSTITGNTFELDNANIAAVKLPGTSTTAPAIVTANQIGYNSGQSYVGPVVFSNDNLVADQDTTDGLYVVGNRSWVNA